MWGGDAVRDYIYIDDAIDGYLKLGSTNIEKIKKNKIFNFGGGNKTTVKEIIEKIIDISGKSVVITNTKEERSNEIKSQYVSFAKAKRILKWEPKTSLEVGLKKTILWYERNGIIEL
jgi:nucleoside-diphosphate-sugar epimerase